MLQFGDANLYMRICHRRDAERLSTVTYSPAELSRYRVFLTAAVTSLHSTINIELVIAIVMSATHNVSITVY